MSPAERSRDRHDNVAELVPPYSFLSRCSGVVVLTTSNRILLRVTASRPGASHHEELSLVADVARPSESGREAACRAIRRLLGVLCVTSDLVHVDSFDSARPDGYEARCRFYAVFPGIDDAQAAAYEGRGLRLFDLDAAVVDPRITNATRQVLRQWLSRAA